MSTPKSTDRIERRVAPGIVQRHAVGCRGGGRGRPCSCAPAYQAMARLGPRGARRTVSATFATLAEALTWREEVKDRARVGQVAAPRPAVPSLEEAARDFLRRVRDGQALARSGRPYSAATAENYETALRRHVLPHVSDRLGVALAEAPADAVDGRVMQGLVSALAVGSPSVARMAEAALAAVLRDLYARGILDAVPPRPALPAPPRARERYLTIEEGERLLEAAVRDDERTGRSLMAPLVALLLGSGCRIAEALALRWGPGGLDLNAGSVTIARETTKTEAGARRVGIEREYLAILRRHRLATGRPEDGALVFCDETGAPLSRSGRVRAGLARVGKAAGLGPVTPHLLRHSHASWLGQAGEPAPDIAARLGHADPAFALRRYVHADRDRVAAPSKRLAELRRQAREP